MPLMASPSTDRIDKELRMDSVKFHIECKQSYARLAKKHEGTRLEARFQEDVRRHNVALEILAANPDCIWVYPKDMK